VHRQRKRHGHGQRLVVEVSARASSGRHLSPVVCSEWPFQ
jgi:hypothetical protein